MLSAWLVDAVVHALFNASRHFFVHAENGFPALQDPNSLTGSLPHAQHTLTSSVGTTNGPKLLDVDCGMVLAGHFGLDFMDGTMYFSSLSAEFA